MPVRSLSPPASARKAAGKQAWRSTNSDATPGKATASFHARRAVEGSSSRENVVVKTKPRALMIQRAEKARVDRSRSRNQRPTRAADEVIITSGSSAVANQNRAKVGDPRR